MREWKRAGGPCRCGCCGGDIFTNELMLVFSSPNWGNGKVFKTRCARCAGEPVQSPATDHDIRPARVKQTTEDTMRRFTGVVQDELFKDR